MSRTRSAAAECGLVVRDEQQGLARPAGIRSRNRRSTSLRGARRRGWRTARRRGSMGGLFAKRPRDRDPLLLAAGECAGLCAEARAQAQVARGARGARAALLAPRDGVGEHHGEHDVLERAEGGQQVERLEDIADVRARNAVARASDRAMISVPPTAIVPPVGRETPAIRLSSVVLPEPLRPREHGAAAAGQRQMRRRPGPGAMRPPPSGNALRHPAQRHGIDASRGADASSGRAAPPARGLSEWRWG